VIRLLDLKPLRRAALSRDVPRCPHDRGRAPLPPRSIFFWHAASARTGTGSMRSESGTGKPVRARLEIARRKAAAKAHARLRCCLRRTPAVIVPAHALAGGADAGRWTLTGCTVAPGFDFSRLRVGARDGSRPPSCRHPQRGRSREIICRRSRSRRNRDEPASSAARIPPARISSGSPAADRDLGRISFQHVLRMALTMSVAM